MKLFNHVSCGILLLTIAAISTTVSAHDGHIRGSANGTHLPAYDQDRLSIIRDRYQSTYGVDARTYSVGNASSQGCSTGDCCGAAGACSINSSNQSTPRHEVAQATVSTLDELEQLSLRLLAVVRDELRGSRDYNNLMADAGDVVRAAQRLRQSESRRASADMMLDDARTMLTPLKRMNTALQNDGQAQRSRRAVQEVGSLLVAFGRNLQTAVSNPARANQNLLPPRPSLSAPNGSQGVAIPTEMKGVALLPVREQEAALRQRTCPVTRGPLGSMGKPTLVEVAGRSVYVCCDGCIDALRRNPNKYLTAGSYGSGVQNRSIAQEQYPGPPPSSLSRNSSMNIPAEMKGVALLPAGEQVAALRQRTCPVNGEPLGSMGKPIRVDVSGRSVYVCCAGCVNAVKRNPQKYLR